MYSLCHEIVAYASTPKFLGQYFCASIDGRAASILIQCRATFLSHMDDVDRNNRSFGGGVPVMTVVRVGFPVHQNSLLRK